MKTPDPWDNKENMDDDDDDVDAPSPKLDDSLVLSHDESCCSFSDVDPDDVPDEHVTPHFTGRTEHHVAPFPILSFPIPPVVSSPSGSLVDWPSSVDESRRPNVPSEGDASDFPSQRSASSRAVEDSFGTPRHRPAEFENRVLSSDRVSSEDPEFLLKVRRMIEQHYAVVANMREEIQSLRASKEELMALQNAPLVVCENLPTPRATPRPAAGDVDAIVADAVERSRREWSETQTAMIQLEEQKWKLESSQLLERVQLLELERENFEQLVLETKNKLNFERQEKEELRANLEIHRRQMHVDRTEFERVRVELEKRKSAEIGTLKIKILGLEERASLVSRLEDEIGRMSESFDDKERALENEVGSVHQQLGEVEKQMEELTRQCQDLREDRQGLKSEVSRCRQKIEFMEKEIVSLKEELRKSERERVELKTQKELHRGEDAGKLILDLEEDRERLGRELKAKAVEFEKLRGDCHKLQQLVKKAEDAKANRSTDEKEFKLRLQSQFEEKLSEMKKKFEAKLIKQKKDGTRLLQQERRVSDLLETELSTLRRVGAVPMADPLPQTTANVGATNRSKSNPPYTRPLPPTGSPQEPQMTDLHRYLYGTIAQETSRLQQHLTQQLGLDMPGGMGLELPPAFNPTSWNPRPYPSRTYPSYSNPRQSEFRRQI